MLLSDVGKLFIVGLSGPRLSDLDKQILDQLQPAGVLLLKRNFLSEAPYSEWLGALEQLLLAVKSYLGTDRYIVSIDHEGGRVHRTPAPLTHFPTATRYASKAFEVGAAMGLELRSIGVNISWSPSCDINSNPSNPIINERAFSSSPDECALSACEFIKGLSSNGVLACIKHFPGHGDTTLDSHHELPTLNLTEEELDQRELIPFIRCIREGAPLVMTSHILFPKIDPDWPATLSSQILRRILREKLGFGGAIVTDDLDMKAILGRFSTAQTMARALNAGCNLFIVARFPNGNSDRPIDLAKGVIEGTISGEISQETLQRSLTVAGSVISSLFPHASLRELGDDVLTKHSQLASGFR